jgi:hypothetical protein
MHFSFLTSPAGQKSIQFSFCTKIAHRLPAGSCQLNILQLNIIFMSTAKFNLLAKMSTKVEVQNMLSLLHPQIIKKWSNFNPMEAVIYHSLIYHYYHYCTFGHSPPY